MFVNFYKNLYMSLIEEGFKQIPGFYDSMRMTEQSKYIGVSRQIGSVLYIALIVNVDNVGINYFKEISDNYRKRMEANSKRLNLRNIFIVNILVTGENADKIKEFVDSSEEYVDQPIITVNWNVVLKGKEVYCSQQQPSNLLNIRELIDKSLLSEVSVNADNFYELIKWAVSKTTLTPARTNGYFVYMLLIINLLMWALTEFAGGSEEASVLIKYGALSYSLVSSEGQLYRLFTSLFLHIGPMHLAFNSLTLYLFGFRAERHLGKLNFLILYFFSGFVGNVLTVLFTNDLSAGASGAIFGLVGAILSITKKSGKNVDGLSFLFMVLYVCVSICLGFLGLSINNYAHIGGLMCGYFAGYALYKQKHKIA